MTPLVVSLGPLLQVLGVVLTGVVAITIPATWGIVGRQRLQTTARTLRPRLREAAPALGVLLGALLVNKYARDVVPELSWLVGVNVTGLIYRLEGTAVAHLQSLATPALTGYFSAVYLVGYVFLLVFPFIAYLALPNLRPLKSLSIAYVLNYTIGLVCYLVFIAYGPRNLLPGAVDPLLYGTFPQTQILTSEVNVNTNVFPSLHTSLSTTVATFAWWTRDQYPAWTVLAVGLAASVILATMYLGIHWLTDVLAGSVLGYGSAVFAARYAGSDDG
jgi:membrane-associated phospholipid phosphatase